LIHFYKRYQKISKQQQATKSVEQYILIDIRIKT